MSNFVGVLMAIAVAVGGKGDSLQWIWDKLLEFWPLGIMDQWQAGVRLRNGIVRKDIKPGLYVRIPFVHRVIEVSCATRTETVTPVPVTTNDGASVKLGVNLRYHIEDPRKWLIEVHDPVQSILNEAESVIATVGATLEWADQWSVEQMNKRITRQMRSRCRRWGVYLEKAELNCFVEAKAYQVFGDSGSLPLFEDEN